MEWLIFMPLLFFFANEVFSHFNDIDKYPLFRHAAAICKTVEKPMLAGLRANIPTKVNGKDASGLFLVGGIFFFWIALGAAAGFLRTQALRLRKRSEKRAVVTGEAALLQKHHEMQAGKLDRAKLLEIYAETKKNLEKHKKHFAFLSIDVVDSTGMKKLEDPGIAERDFRKYKALVEKALNTNRALKSTWTPDGAMICFASADQAIRAAQDVIRNLKTFNSSVKAIKTDFRIRAGINSGEVFCDDKTPMEEMTDRVIDIAGHMQKHGAVNAVSTRS